MEYMEIVDTALLLLYKLLIKQTYRKYKDYKKIK